MDKQDSALTVISALLAVAALVYLYLQNKNAAANSAPVATTTAPGVSTSVPQAFSPYSAGVQGSGNQSLTLPGIDIPGDSIIINSGPRLFPLFGYAAG